MAVLKCKMCGGDLEVTEEMTVCECEYCGTRQTVPTLDDEKKIKLFERANKLRANCEFDKAAGVYENIVADYSEEAEGYWGLILCRYGIEYVDDPSTGKKIPTCHRSSFDSIMDDEDFEMIMENSDSASRVVYREEAKYIEEVRKGIIEVSGKEDPYDIFICYKETDENGDRTIDSVIAQDVYDALTEKGYRVFFSRISLESKLGVEYEPYIFAALNSAKVMLAFGTSYDYYNAVWVKNEWSRYLKLMAKDKTKHLIPCFKNVDAYDIPKEFAKLQAQDMGKVGAVQDLLRGIEKILSKDGRKAEEQSAVTVSQSDSPGVASLLRRGHLFLEDGEWESAYKYFDKVLDIDPENAEAYFGQLLVARRVHCRDELVNQENAFDKEPLYQKALRFADTDFDTVLKQLVEENQHIVEEKLHLDWERRSQYRKRIAPAANYIAAGDHIVALRSNGTVMAAGKNSHGECNVSEWTDIVAIAAGSNYTVGLKSDGGVMVAGEYRDGGCDVSDWSDIAAIAVYARKIVGLKRDGSVVTANGNNGGECDVSGWRDIVAIAAGFGHIVGLKSDGSVVAAGHDYGGECDVSGWTDIVAIAAGSDHTVGLRNDGSVVAVGYNVNGECNVSDWSDIVAIAAGFRRTIGLKRDGRVVAVGAGDGWDVLDWSDIVATAVGFKCTVGLKSDGSMVVDGTDGSCDVYDWRLFQSLDTLEQERKEMMEQREQEKRLQEEREAAERARKKAEEEREAAERARKKTELEQEKEVLEAELANLKGMFTGKRRKELETMIAEINQKLNLLG